MQTTGMYRRIITYIRDTNTAVNQNSAVLSTDNVAEEFHTRNETGPTYRPITPVISLGPPFPLAWINFNPNMYKISHVQWSVAWNYLSTPQWEEDE